MEGMELVGIAAILWYILQVIGCWRLLKSGRILPYTIRTVTPEIDMKNHEPIDVSLA